MRLHTGDEELAHEPTLGPRATPRPPEPEYAVTTRGLVKSYPGPQGTTTAVDGLDLDVWRGETFAFLGPNGAGKSTTIAMLCALARPTARPRHGGGRRRPYPAPPGPAAGRHALPAERPRPGPDA